MGKYDLHSTPLPCWKHTFLFSFGGYFFRQAHPSEWNITCKHTWGLLPWALHDFFSTDSVLEPSGLNFQSCQLQIFPRFMLGPGAHEVHQVRLAANNCGMFFQRACERNGTVFTWKGTFCSALMDIGTVRRPQRSQIQSIQSPMTSNWDQLEQLMILKTFPVFFEIMKNRFYSSAYNIICLWNVYIYNSRNMFII